MLLINVLGDLFIFKFYFFTCILKILNQYHIGSEHISYYSNVFG